MYCGKFINSRQMDNWPESSNSYFVVRPRAWEIKGKKATVFRNTRAINPEAKTQFKSIKPIMPSPKRNLYIQITLMTRIFQCGGGDKLRF